MAKVVSRRASRATVGVGVAVVIEASHGCMSGRGVRQHGVSMVTHCWLGEFNDDPQLRRDLLAALPLGGTGR